ncbi:MAG: hypothetical protein EAZ90_06310 [Oscillatoriales cyanobacterium]|jgi:hypothetical protein|nr:MAG: hypothetical protein EAZ94_02440 [Oscillatoriales cyanobacterium]TAE27923.1 MAG: hypothetical protein EAZ93_03945 [Oscillatoriales cyanobacterium]TAE44490.1 MAG: hypothetical protein EAZ90_06310 [Oscillatoriales cyanobacterium]TAE49544.1 MAG: hypothetical protein EAZ88_22170 [Oscillatoriales cyanobacterium]TAE71183.1 MAG: hypothetical protein EAZ86_04125 [Oscillatoriales cyanobacterium]
MSIALSPAPNLTRRVAGESSYLENGLLHRCVGARDFFSLNPVSDARKCDRNLLIAYIATMQEAVAHLNCIF